MSDLRELYQELIIDHGRHPRNFGSLAAATYIKEGFNPLCGDKLKLYLQVVDGVVIAARFEGAGCAISMASASLMTERVVGLTLEQIDALFANFHDLVTGKSNPDAQVVGKLLALGGVSEFPSRVKCATLAWHTLVNALHEMTGPVSTE